LGDPLRHRMQAWQLPTQKTVMGFHDVGTQFMEWQFGGIRPVICSDRRFLAQLVEHVGFSEILVFTGLAQRATALAAEINAEGLENARTAGSLGNKLTDGAVNGGGPWGGIDVGFMAHAEELVDNRTNNQEKTFFISWLFYSVPFGQAVWVVNPVYPDPAPERNR
jgi:hypothetical protein